MEGKMCTPNSVAEEAKGHGLLPGGFRITGKGVNPGGRWRNDLGTAMFLKTFM